MIISDNNCVSTFFVFQKSMRDNLNISDVIIRMLAIENFYGKNDFGFSLYNRMQQTRVANNPKVLKEKANYEGRFIELIESFRQKGFDPNFPIELNKKQELLDGSHRFSLAMYHRIPVIPYYISKTNGDADVDYSVKWFASHGLADFVPIIEKKYTEIVQNYKCQT